MEKVFYHIWKKQKGQKESPMGSMKVELKDKFDKDQNLSFDWGGHLEYAMAKNSGRWKELLL